MPKGWPPRIPPSPPNKGHWRAGRKFPWWKDENRVWSKRRRRGMAQKPWNKPTRMEKFWSPAQQLVSNAMGTIGTTGTNAVLAKFWSGETLTDPSAATQAYALSHCKIHRFQGDIFVWMDPFSNNNIAFSMADGSPAASIGRLPGPTMCMCTYVWLKLKEVANANVLNGVAAATNYNPRFDEDLTKLLRRDDIMRWGTIPVFGIEPRMTTVMNQDGGNPGTDIESFVVGNAGSYLHDRVAKVPLPKFPKAGLNLHKGEALCLFLAVWPGPSAFTASLPGSDPKDPHNVDTANPVNVNVYDVSRVLCSL